MSNTTATLLNRITEADQDFEWYPTSPRMIAAVKHHIPEDAASIMDIGAGDGRVLLSLAEKCTHAQLFAIEKSPVLVQAHPENVVPAGTDFYEQNLACLPVDYIFCNPPYSQFEEWAVKIIESGFAKLAFLVIPQRWRDSEAIKAALMRRKAVARTIHSDDFLDGERQARAVVDIVEIRYPTDGGYREHPTDPFDIWFDQYVDVFDQAREVDKDMTSQELARKYAQSNIQDLVAGYLEEHGRLETNYHAIFKLDQALLRELGVAKDAVREGIKAKMAGLKTKYWQLLFDRLDAITSRLSTKTKEHFLTKLTGRATIAFTADNAYAVVLWAIKNANRYFDEQLVTLFKDLSTFEGVHNYKSNTKTWQKNGWRYNSDKDNNSHYSLDYRIVLSKYSAIKKKDDSGFECWGNLHKGCHEVIADVIAVMSNLGFATSICTHRSRDREWIAGEWQDFHNADEEVLFQVKAHLNGNLHFRFMPKAIRRFNIEAGRLLGWLQNVNDAVQQLGYDLEEVKQSFGSNMCLAPSNIKLLTGDCGVTTHLAAPAA